MQVYAFSKWLNRESACHEWFDWFKKRGIPAAIVRHKYVFSVWREGIDHTGIREGWHQDYLVLRRCNGFDK